MGTPTKILLGAVVIAGVAVALMSGLEGDQLEDQEVDVALLNVTTEVLATGFSLPVAVAVIEADEYLVTDRIGHLHHHVAGETVRLEGGPNSEIFNIGAGIAGGLMDVSLHPDFAANGLVYVSFFSPETSMAVARFDFSDRVIRELEIIFETNASAVGATIEWQDSEHFFLTHATTNPQLPQDLSSDAGKIHRLLADGSVPGDNPTFEGADGQTSIWSIGHRNGQGLYAEDGVLYATEDGDIGGDELNVIESGGNYGFPFVTSGDVFDFRGAPGDIGPTIAPVRTWNSLSLGPTGLVRLVDSSFPGLDGHFLFGALATEQLIGFDLATGDTTVLLTDVGRIRDVDQLPDGDIVIVVESTADSASNGQLIRLSPAQ